jgi:subtilisin family serine protease
MSTLVDLLAPGGTTIDSSPHSIMSSVPQNRYDYMAGTSMAAPHIAGAFAALKSVYPLSSVDGILAALTGTGVLIADTRNNADPNFATKKPRIQVDRALVALGPPTLSVASTADTEISGNAGGPFFPATFEYEISATGPLTFTVTSNQPWLVVSPARGTLDAGGNIKIMLTVQLAAFQFLR